MKPSLLAKGVKRLDMGPIEKDPYRRLVSSLFSLILYPNMDPYSLLLLSMGPELKRLVVATGPIIRVQY